MKKNGQGKDQELLFTYFNELNIISQLSTGIFERTLPEGLTSSQFSVLNWFVRVDDTATPGRLSTAFQVTKGAMTNTLKKLKEKQLVTVLQDETSGRRKIVTMTKRGREVRDRAISAIQPLLSEFAEEVKITEIEQQLVAIRKVRRYLDEYRYRR
jgi:DNA-binding MarR family transcriptional regulator